jgi:hypothetical protein
MGLARRRADRTQAAQVARHTASRATAPTRVAPGGSARTESDRRRSPSRSRASTICASPGVLGVLDIAGSALLPGKEGPAFCARRGGATPSTGSLTQRFTGARGSPNRCAPACKHGALLQVGDTDAGLDLMSLVVDGRAAIHGPGHPWTLARRLQLAGRTGAAGRHDSALALAITAATDCETALGSDHELALAARHQQALWTAMSDPAAATEQLRRLRADCQASLGTDHPLTANCELHLTAPGDDIWYYLPRVW